MNGIFLRGLLCVCISLAVQLEAPAQDEVQAKTEDEMQAAEQARAAESAQIKAAVTELQAKLQQAQDEVQQALEQRDGQEQTAELKEQLQAARAEADQTRAEAESQRRKLEQALLELKQNAVELARERDRAAAAKHQTRAAQDAARRRLEHFAVQSKHDPNSAEAQAQTGGPGSRDERGGRHVLFNAASEALERAEEERKLAEILQKLRALGRSEEANRIEAQAHEWGITLDQGPRRLANAMRKEAAVSEGVHRAIVELREEVRQLRDEVQGLRRMLEARPAANESASRALRREDLCHIRSRVAGEIVRLGTIEGDASEVRSIRAGDLVCKGQVLAVVCCDQIGEMQHELVEAIATLSADQRTLEEFRKVYQAGALTEREFSDQTRIVEVDQGEIRRLERTLHAWHVDEADLAAIREQAQRNAPNDSIAETGDARLPWGQVKVRAPVDGVVLERNISQGELIQLDSNLFILQAAEAVEAARN